MAAVGSFYLLVDPPLEGSRNMEIDQKLLDSAEERAELFTVVRFYSWQAPTVSIGRNQQAEQAADAAYCELHGIPIVRRPTGGRAVLHDNELTYSLVSNDGRLFAPGRLDLSYLRVALGLKAGLSRLNIQTELAAGVRETGRATRGPGKSPCFASASRHELLVGGRKIAGSAQRRLKRSFLQHGSIPLGLNCRLMAKALGAPESLIAMTSTCVSDAAGREVGFDELARVLTLGFRESLGLMPKIVPDLHSVIAASP